MYAYIIGKITEIQPNYIVLENNDIGFLILVPNPYVYVLDERVKIHIYHHVREDVFSYYGFKTLEQKSLFLKLISVSGIGPKTALGILAPDLINELTSAINNGDVKFLTQFPGIGLKTAGQIILDLKGKIMINDNDTEKKSKLPEVIEALLALGYSRVEVSRVSQKVDIRQPLSEIIKEALRLLL